MEAWREELYHHGILGQKWGSKNGPPVVWLMMQGKSGISIIQSN